jgi:hypothetical protein
VHQKSQSKLNKVILKFVMVIFSFLFPTFLILRINIFFEVIHQLFFNYFLLLHETVFIDRSEYFFYFYELVAVPRQHFALVEGVLHLKLCKFILLAMGFLVIDLVSVSEIDAMDFLIEVPPVEIEQLRHDNANVGLLRELPRVDEGDDEHDQAVGIDPPEVGLIEVVLGQFELEQDDNGAQSAYFLQPVIDLLRRDDAKVVTDFVVGDLDGEIGLYLSGVLDLPAEELLVFWGETLLGHWDLGLDGQLDDGDGCGFDDFLLADP